MRLLTFLLSNIIQINLYTIKNITINGYFVKIKNYGRYPGCNSIRNEGVGSLIQIINFVQLLCKIRGNHIIELYAEKLRN